jgi:hypothetical protein
MRVTHTLAVLPLALLISACGPDASYEAEAPSASYSMATPQPVAMSDADMMAPQAIKRSGRQVEAVQGGEAQSPASMIAYRYGYGINLPAPAVEPVMRAHMERCLQAGQTRCQVLNASSQTRDADYTSAFLSLRAAPEWLDEFRSGLETSLEERDGRVVDSSVSAEDLTRQIFDADARLTAQTALRERLLRLLETRDAELNELLSVERELARVQAQIESATSQLKTLRQRVSMSVVDLRYESRQRAVTPTSVSPVVAALKDFVGTLSEGLAGVIRFIAAALPWLLFVILPLIFILRWALRRRSRRATPKA